MLRIVLFDIGLTTIKTLWILQLRYASCRMTFRDNHPAPSRIDAHWKNNALDTNPNLLSEKNNHDTVFKNTTLAYRTSPDTCRLVSDGCNAS